MTRSIDGTLSEVCLALDAGSGKELWATAIGGAKYPGGGDSGAQDNKGSDGPRSPGFASTGFRSGCETAVPSYPRCFLFVLPTMVRIFPPWKRWIVPSPIVWT